MDRAGRRPILLSGAAAMAVFLTLTGYWIYIDQAYTPNAGEFGRWRVLWPVTHRRSGRLRHHLQCSVRHVMGTCPLALPARNYASTVPSKGSLDIDGDQLALCAYICVLWPVQANRRVELLGRCIDSEVSRIDWVEALLNARILLLRFVCPR